MSRPSSPPSPPPTPRPRASSSPPMPSPSSLPWCCRPGDRCRGQQGNAGLFRLADTPEKMVALGLERITELIRTIGLYRTKARNVLALSHELLSRFGGEVPADRAALESPRRRPEDRQCCPQHRLRRADHRRRHAPVPRRQPHRPRPGRRRSRWRRIMQVVPENISARPSLADPARRYVCKARKPECYRCLIAAWCRFTPRRRPPLAGTGRRCAEPVSRLCPPRTGTWGTDGRWLTHNSTCSPSAMRSSTSSRRSSRPSSSPRAWTRASCISSMPSARPISTS